MSDITEKRQALAREILVLSRNTLLVNLRFLDMALSQFTYVPVESEAISTDGRHIFYDPMHVLLSYREEKERPVREYLHMVMHCVFQHLYSSPTLRRDLWDLACDVAAEYAVKELGLAAARVGREWEEIRVFETLEKEIGRLTAEKIYRYYLDRHLSEQEIASLREVFLADSHETWYRLDPAGDGSSDSESNAADNRMPNRKEQEKVWKDIAERMQMDLETFSKIYGDQAGTLMQNLKSINREKYDYAAFLKKFAVMGEVMKVNDDEFDYVYYTYGLEQYGNMPLIEPLEYKEVKRVREFVIAIDTSGSVVGDEVQAFVTKTYNILKSTESFFTKINLHIIQCDADIQEHVKITCQEEFDEYIRTMKILGLGGTDFRPVFRLVDELIREKEFRDLKALIYFTDGIGTFPKKKPEYETSFVFVNDEDESPEVPSWAIKLVLRRDEL